MGKITLALEDAMKLIRKEFGEMSILRLGDSSRRRELRSIHTIRYVSEGGYKCFDCKIFFRLDINERRLCALGYQ